MEATAPAAQTPYQTPPLVAQARAFAAPLLGAQLLDTGEGALAHADAVAQIVAGLDGAPELQAACYLAYASEHLSKPDEVLGKAFGPGSAELALQTLKLMRVQRLARQGKAVPDSAAQQAENIRKMVLAFSRDLRVVLVRLASRLQTLRHHAAQKKPLPAGMAHEALHVFAALANRLGIWQLKWEMEDLAFRALEPQTYHEIARWLDAKRVEREAYVEQLRQQIQQGLAAQGVTAQVFGRPKHIYSIVRKMRGKALPLARVLDVRALRVIAPDIAQCYAALAWVHQQYQPLDLEFDDYIAKPKSNGYQSLHTVVQDAQGLAFEVQIRTQAMHDHAEHGVAAHWAYKEAGVRGYAGALANGSYEAKIAVLRQLLAWQQDLTGMGAAQVLQDRIYVLTPQATVVDLPAGATPVDFAYAVHTDLGHRCRGARVDGAMVPLNTPLSNGQTVEIVVAKSGGPSRDWLNPELAYLNSARARAKVRSWFNAQALGETLARGREAVEKLLQREGKTAIKLEDLSNQLGFDNADALFEAVGKDEYSLRQIETALRPAIALPSEDERVLTKRAHSQTASPDASAVLVQGVGALLTQLARCCRPAPPDAIGGFVTRGKGVSVHRADCSNFKQMAQTAAQRVLPVQWGTSAQGNEARYSVDLAIQAQDRQGLLRDISEVLAREKINVVGVQTQSVKGTAWMTFTVEVSNAGRLHHVLQAVRDVRGVQSARRR